jgi:hypothetical protein
MYINADNDKRFNIWRDDDDGGGGGGGDDDVTQ